MKGLLTGSILLLAITLLASGCATTEPDDGPLSSCITYEADGFTYLECPIWGISSGPRTQDIYKYSTLGRYYARLSGCPESLYYMDTNWTLVETTSDLCIYCDLPLSQLAVPGAVEQIRPEIHLVD